VLIIDQEEAWLDADEIERLAATLDEVTTFFNTHGLLAAQLHVTVYPIAMYPLDDTGRETVDAVFFPYWDGDTPYLMSVYDHATDQRAAWAFDSEDLRKVASRLRTLEDGAVPGSMTVEFVNDGTYADPPNHPELRVENQTTEDGRTARTIHL
jgi:hypothetical protein